MSDFTLLNAVADELCAMDGAVDEVLAEHRSGETFDWARARKAALASAFEIVALMSDRYDEGSADHVGQVEAVELEVPVVERHVSLDGRLDDDAPLAQLLAGLRPGPARDDDWATHDAFERLSKYGWYEVAGRVNLDDDLSIVPVNGFLDVWDDDAKCWATSDVEVTAVIARHLRFVGVRLDAESGITWGDLVGDDESRISIDGAGLDDEVDGWVEWSLLSPRVRSRWAKWCRANGRGTGRPVRKYDVIGLQRFSDLDGLEQHMADLRKAIQRSGGHERRPEQSAGRDRVAAALAFLN